MKKRKARAPSLHKRQVHRLSYLPEYRTWQNMITRCYNKTTRSYKTYGARGIIVCARWLLGEGGVHPFVCFLQDMGQRPTPAHQIDRHPDNDGNYELSNCRWATTKEQGWSKVGKARADLAAFNKSRIGKPLPKKHRKAIAATLTGRKRGPYKNRGKPLDPEVVKARRGKKRGPYKEQKK